MSELHTESTFVSFLRAAVLLGALIAIPGTAVCWNMFPTDFLAIPKSESYTEKTFTTDNAETDDAETEPESTVSNLPESLTAETEQSEPAGFALSSAHQKDPFQSVAVPTPQAGTTPEPNPFGPIQSDSAPTAFPIDSSPIRPMGGTADTLASSETVIPVSYSDEPVKFASDRQTELEPLKLVTSPSAQPLQPLSLGQAPTPSISLSQKNFPMLEEQLKKLGAKYYSLEKWGSRGELYRFSCYVSSQYQYQKLFQAIDSDEIRVMEQVIENIKAWKN